MENMNVLKRASLFLLVAILLGGTHSSLAAGFYSPPKLPKWQLQIGAAMTNLEQRFDVPSAYASKVSQIRGLLGVQRNFSISKRWAFIPEVFTLLPWRSGADASTKVFTTQFGLRFAFSIFPWMRMNFGPGIFWESYVSESEGVSLSNGTGTSTFYTPSSWQQVLLFSAQGSLEACFSASVCLSAGVLAPDPLDAVRRRLHGVLKLGIAL